VACPPLTVAERARFTLLQAYADAIAYRRARLAASCPGCGPGPARCDDHATDADLIAAYRRAAIGCCHPDHRAAR
jgi:hypothetical protein